MVKKYILTGGPCTGKSTMLQVLGNEGYQIIPEAARLIIEDEQLKKSKCLPWIDREKFQKAVLKKQLDLEKRLKDSPEAFLDRGIPDGLAYYKLDEIIPPIELINLAKNNRYIGIFLMQRLHHYQCDLIRKENYETAQKIQKYIKETYEELGYEVIEIPPLTIEERKGLIKK